MNQVLRLLSGLPAVLRHPALSREKLLEYQGQRLHALMRHAYANVPFYRDKLQQAGLTPDDFRSGSDIEKLPPITKSDLQQAPLEKRIARGMAPERLIGRTTSGSTGQPFTIYRTQAEDHFLQLFRIRAMRLFGVRPRDRVVAVSGTDFHIDRRDLTGALVRRFGIYQKEHVDCQRADNEVLADLASRKIDILAGYPGALSYLAPLLEARYPGRIRPRFIQTGGEPLTRLMKKRITDVFDVPVRELYGAHEFNLLGWQCKHHDHLHACEDNVIFEILKDGQPAQPGERGEIVATGLHTYAMPFIRFRTGDMATRGEELCPCGQPFATVSQIDGRTVDYFQLPDGRTLHPFLLTDPLFVTSSSWVHQFQLSQIAADRAVIRIVPLQQPGAEDLEQLRKAGQDILGPAMIFEVELTDRIPPGPGGKFRAYRNEVKERLGESAAQLLEKDRDRSGPVRQKSANRDACN